MCRCYFCKLGWAWKHNKVRVSENVIVQVCRDLLFFITKFTAQLSFSQLKPGQSGKSCRGYYFKTSSTVLHKFSMTFLTFLLTSSNLSLSHHCWTHNFGSRNQIVLQTLKLRGDMWNAWRAQLLIALSTYFCSSYSLSVQHWCTPIITFTITSKQTTALKQQIA